MYCRHCGSKVGDNDMVCANCGALTEYGQRVANHDAIPPENNANAINPDGSLNKDAYRPGGTAGQNGGSAGYQNGNYYYAPENAGYRPRENQKSNSMALAGFICSFFVSLVGFILSIIGYRKSKERNGEGRGLAIAGIIISIVSMVLSFFWSSWIFSTILRTTVSVL